MTNYKSSPLDKQMEKLRKKEVKMEAMQDLRIELLRYTLDKELTAGAEEKILNLFKKDKKISIEVLKKELRRECGDITNNGNKILELIWRLL